MCEDVGNAAPPPAYLDVLNDREINGILGDVARAAVALTGMDGSNIASQSIEWGAGQWVGTVGTVSTIIPC